ARHGTQRLSALLKRTELASWQACQNRKLEPALTGDNPPPPYQSIGGRARARYRTWRSGTSDPSLADRLAQRRRWPASEPGPGGDRPCTRPALQSPIGCGQSSVVSRRHSSRTVCIKSDIYLARGIGYLLELTKT